MTGVPAGIAIHRRDIRIDWSGALCAPLSPEERHRADRFVRDDDRRRFVTGRHLVRTTFGAMLGCAAGDVPIAIDVHGRPHVADAPAFSLTHSGDCVALAVACGRSGAVGIDIEAIRTDIDPLALGRQVFAPAELAILREAGDPIATFFRTWTLKEAVLKAAGRGLLVDPRELCIDVQCDPPAIVRVPAGVAVDGCVILPSPPGYAAALAWCGVHAG